MAFRPTVIGSKLSAWICQPFCCQRTIALIPSERLSIPLKPCLNASLQKPSNNKKPGVERRAKSPIQVTLREARLVLSGVARKEPHYRVYFRPSLDSALGRTLLLPDCDAPAWLNYPRAICEYTRIMGFVKRSEKLFLGLSVNFGGLRKSPIKSRGFAR
jgi:hypothetical protein